LYEIENLTEMISEDLKSVPEIADAIELTRESAYTRAQLEAYDKYWDSISIEKTYIADAEVRGKAIGEAIGEARGVANVKIAIAINCFKKGFDIKEISEITSLSEAEINKIISELK
jgi:predicted transposase/invertase (TIGR01784 family)